MSIAPKRHDTGRVVLVANTSWYLYNFRHGTLKSLITNGWDVTCIAPRDSYSRRLQVEMNVEYREVDIGGTNRGLLVELRSLIRLWRLLKATRPRFVFNFTVKANIYGGITSWSLRIPYANNISGLGAIFAKTSAFYRTLQFVYAAVNNRATRLFFQNSDDLARFRRIGLADSTNTVLIRGSGVNLDKFSATALPPRPIRFLLLARLIAEKGIREYIAAARLLRQYNTNCQCILAGAADLDAEGAISLEEVVSWQKEGVVEFVGFIDDVRRLVQTCHVLVLPTYYHEGMPKTLLEAAAMGRPAIVTDTPGCREAILPGATGWVCEPNNVQSLYDAMSMVTQLSHDTLVRFGAMARNHAELHFSESAVIDAYLDCLR